MSSNQLLIDTVTYVLIVHNHIAYSEERSMSLYDNTVEGWLARQIGIEDK